MIIEDLEHHSEDLLQNTGTINFGNIKGKQNINYSNMPVESPEKELKK